jgi:hypothetical protein
MQLNNLSLAPDLANDPNPDLVWLTQWLVPSTTDPNGGKNFFVYAESTGGGAVQCFAAESRAMRDGDWYLFTYPGNTPLPAANCLVVPGPNGTITIDVPISMVSEVNPIDDRLHEVTASTMTLAAPANSTYPPVGLYGGSEFNVIDVAQPYVFRPSGGGDPAVSVVSRKMHGSAGPFDIDLPLTGTRGVESRGSGGVNDYTLVFTFLNNLTSVGSASVSGHDPASGTGSVLSSSLGPNANQYTVNLTGVSTGQYITITLNSVLDATGASGNVIGPQMGVLVGDVNASGIVTSGDTNLCKAQALQPVTIDNFRNDINASGSITTGDVNLIKQNALSQLPSPP